jgi:hypothetical protein
MTQQTATSNINSVDVQLVLQAITRVKGTNPALAVELLKQVSDIVLPAEETALETHSFKILPTKLELIRNIVYTKKQAGHTTYSQTQAIHEAVDLLAQTMTVKQRGKEERMKEDAKAIVISRSMKKSFREKVQQEVDNNAAQQQQATAVAVQG